jgi:hypothetical protein
MLMVLEGVRLIDEENAPAIVESEVREVEPVPEAEDGPIRSRRRRFTVMLGISIVVSMTAASFVGLPFVFPGLDTEPVEPVTVAGRGAPISPIMLASREDRPTAPTPLYLDRPEFWILQMSASTTAPEADQTTESVSHRADAIGSPDPGPAIHTPVVEQEVVEDPPVPTLEGPFPQSVEFPVSIEPGYVDLVVKSSVKSGLLVVEIDGQSVYSQPLQKKAKSVKRFLNKMTGQADERFHTTLEVEPGPHEILALVEIHGKKVRYESRLEVDLDSGGRETIEVSLGRVFGKRLAMAVVDPAVSEEIIE